MVLTMRKPFTLPYEPDSTAHLDAEKRRLSIRAFLEAQEAALHDSPPVAPTLPALTDDPTEQPPKKKS
jgi:hypothetical protein